MSSKIRLMTDTAVMVAVATILGFFQYEGPWANGGSISLEMLAILLMAFRHGLKGGLLTGFIYGFVDFLFEPIFVHPAQLLLDYPIAFMMVGFAGIMKLNTDRTRFQQGTTLVIGTFIGVGLRFISHFISAMVWFGQYAPEGTPVWLYAVGYNVSYLIPCFFLNAFLLVLLVLDTPRLVRPQMPRKA